MKMNEYPYPKVGDRFLDTGSNDIFIINGVGSGVISFTYEGEKMQYTLVADTFFDYISRGITKRHEAI